MVYLSGNFSIQNWLLKLTSGGGWSLYQRSFHHRRQRCRQANHTQRFARRKVKIFKPVAQSIELFFFNNEEFYGFWMLI